MLSQRFHDISTIDRECIVAVKWLKAFSIGVMGPSNGTANFQRAYLLEALEPHASEVEVFHRLAAWKTLASLSGLKIRTNRGDDETDAVIERADLNRPLLAEALALRNFWPLGFLSLEGRARSLLLEQAAMEHDAHEQPGEQDEPIIEGEEASPPQLMPAEVAAEPSSPPDKTGDEELVSNLDSHHAENMGDFLDPDLDQQVVSGMHPPLFITQGHHLRQGAPWAVVLTFPQKRRGRPGYDALICSLADPHRYANDTTCVLRAGKPGEGSKVSTPEVRLWKVVAACFGVNAVANVSQPIEPFTHERTRRLIKKYGDLVLSAIDAWPVLGHAQLKPIARMRALSVLGNHSAAESNASNAGDSWAHLCPPSTSADDGVLGIRIDADLSNAGEGPASPLHGTLAAPIQIVAADAPAAESSSHRQARAALKDRLLAAQAALSQKQELIDRLTAEVASERTAVAAQEAQLARIDELIKNLDLAFQGV